MAHGQVICQFVVSVSQSSQLVGTLYLFVSVSFSDQSVKSLGLTSASEALLNYPPQLAVDGNFRTCFFSNRRKPRWWRVELPKQAMQNQSIISVALTLPPIRMLPYFCPSNGMTTDVSITILRCRFALFYLRHRN